MDRHPCGKRLSTAENGREYLALVATSSDEVGNRACAGVPCQMIVALHNRAPAGVALRSESTCVLVGVSTLSFGSRNKKRSRTCTGAWGPLQAEPLN